MYLYYHCDEYKSRESMILIGVFDEATMRDIIVEDLNDTDIVVNEKLEIEEIYDMDIKDLNELIKYCYIREININERIRGF